MTETTFPDKEIAQALAQVAPDLYRAIFALVFADQPKEQIMRTVRRVSSLTILDSAIEVTVDYLIEMRAKGLVIGGTNVPDSLDSQ